ncbi:MAG: sulfatase-like hydrolase/transferase, partial [Chitinophagaceae bacterium]|nr:sulfatase-like hydrolase/transferase [Chitinophagaceae bacterium]
MKKIIKQFSGLRVWCLSVFIILANICHAQKPNIIIIMADDLDSKQLSCYGGKNIVTKNIDALAIQGIKFNQMICSET